MHKSEESQFLAVHEFNDKGINARISGNIEEAIEWHMKAAETASRIKGPSVIRITCDIAWKLGIGNTLLEFNRCDDAIVHLRDANRLAEQLAQNIGESAQTYLVKSLSAISRCLLSLGEIENALYYSNRYKLFSYKDKLRSADASSMVGQCLYYLQEYDDAINALQESYNLYIACNNTESATRTQALLIKCKQYAGSYANKNNPLKKLKPENQPKKGMKINDIEELAEQGRSAEVIDATDNLQEENLLMARITNATIEMQSGKYAEARAILERLIESNSFRGAPLPFQHLTRVFHGTCLRNLGKLDEALENYNNAANFIEQAPTIAGSAAQYAYLKATCYAERAVTYLERGRFLDALSDCNKALKETSNPLMTGNILLTKASAERRIGLVEDSLETNRLALDIFTNSDYTRGQALAHNNIGNCLLCVHKVVEAESHFASSLKLLSNDKRESSLQLGRAHIGLAACCRNNSELSKAQNHVIEAQEYFDLVHSPKDMSSALLLNLELQREMNINTAFPTMRSKLRELSLKIWDPIILSEIYRLQAMELRQAGDLQGAIAAQEQAIAIDETMLQNTMGDIHTILYSSRRPNLYSEIVDILLDDNDIVRAFDFVEKARIRSFTHTLGPNWLPLQNNKQDRLLDEEETVLSELNMLQSTLQTPSSEVPEKWADARNRLKSIYQQMRQQTDLAGYAEMKESLGLPLSSIHEYLPYTHETSSIISLFQQKERLIVFIKLPKRDKPRCKIFNISESAVNELTAKLEQPFQNYSQSKVVSKQAKLEELKHDFDNAITKISASLSSLLEQFPSETPLLILPHGPLFKVPFHALTINGKYLICRQPVHYVPGISLLPYCQKLASKRSKCLAIGVDFEDEAKLVASKFKEYPPLLGNEARSDIIRRLAETADVIHFSTHGISNPKEGGLVHLNLGSGERFTLNDAFALKLKADLVVLAACHSGRNISLSSNESFGLARGFIFAGTACVISTLWPVFDEASMCLMDKLYDFLSIGQSKAIALCNAQKSMIADKRFKNPLYWAPFFMLGDGGN